MKVSRRRRSRAGKKEAKDKAKREQQERQRHEGFVAMLKEKSSAAVDQGESVIHCRRCGSADLHFVQLQTRSADEPMTSLFCCNQCSLKWRMN